MTPLYSNGKRQGVPEGTDPAVAVQLLYRMSCSGISYCPESHVENTILMVSVSNERSWPATLPQVASTPYGTLSESIVLMAEAGSTNPSAVVPSISPLS